MTTDASSLTSLKGDGGGPLTPRSQARLAGELEELGYHVTQSLKACCADLYASDWVRLLIGDSLHPGGLALTERLGALLCLGPDSRVLDLAAGRGTSALHLARVFGCHVVGVDLSSTNVAAARETAVGEGLAERAQFEVGDAERLNRLAEGSFDVVVCECAYCTFSDKRSAAREIARVLRPGGRLGLSDLTRSGPLPPELDGLLAWIACIADALSVDGYVGACEAAGLRVECIEEHNQALMDLVHQVRGRLVAADLFAKLGQLELPSPVQDLQQATSMARSAAQAVEDGTLGYSLIVALKRGG